MIHATYLKEQWMISFFLHFVGTWFLLTWLLVSLYTWFARGSNSLQKKQFSFLWRKLYLQQVIIFSFIKLDIPSSFLCLLIEQNSPQFFSCHDVCNLQREQRWRWLPLHDIQRGEHIWFLLMANGICNGLVAPFL